MAKAKKPKLTFEGVTEVSADQVEATPEVPQATEADASQHTEPNVKAAAPEPAAAPAAKAKAAPAPKVKVTPTIVADEPSSDAQPEPAKTAGAKKPTRKRTASTKKAPAKKVMPVVQAASAQSDAPKATAATQSASAGPATAASPAGVRAWLSGALAGHENAVVGGFVGLVVAFCMFVAGFWQTLFVSILVVVGIAVGQYLDGDPKIINALIRLIDLGRNKE